MGIAILFLFAVIAVLNYILLIAASNYDRQEEEELRKRFREEKKDADAKP